MVSQPFYIKMRIKKPPRDYDLFQSYRCGLDLYRNKLRAPHRHKTFSACTYDYFIATSAAYRRPYSNNYMKMLT